MSARYVTREAEPRFLVTDPRHREYECGHCSTAESGYRELAYTLMFATDRWRNAPLDTDASSDRFSLVNERLARWLAWRDSLRPQPPSPALHILLELQRMAAEHYTLAHIRYDSYLSAIGSEREDIACGVAVRTQWHAAALSRLVRIGLGIEPAEER